MLDDRDRPVPTHKAIGLLETRGLVTALVACDAMLKSAQVRLLQQQVTRPALVTVCITGETAAVAEALAVGVRAAERVGPVVGKHLIAHPTDATLELLSHLALDAHALGVIPLSSMPPLASLSVPRLRTLARALPDCPLSGREISLANRQTLLALLEPRDSTTKDPPEPQPETRG
jgi:ethanolamine utilization microcompartment shell protein EutS